MLKKILLLIIMMSPCWSNAQRVSIRSKPANFTKVMAYESPSTVEIDTILALCLSYIFTNSDTSLLLAERGLEHSERMYQGDTIHAESLLFLGDALRARSEFEPALEALLHGRGLCLKLGLEKRAASANLKLGAVSTRTEEYEEALNYQLSALATFERLNDSANIYKPWIEISEIFYRLDQPHKALEYNAKALAWGRAINAPRLTMFALSNQGGVLQNVANNFKIRVDTVTGDATALIDSVKYYHELAMASYHESLSLHREYGDTRSIARILTNMVNILPDIGDYEQALSLATEAEILIDRLNASDLRLGNSTNLAKIYRLMGEPVKALAVAKKAIKSPEAATGGDYLNSLREELYFTNKSLGNFEQALVYHELMVASRSVKETTERTKVISTVEAKYQNIRKEKQILELNVANAAIQRKNYLYMISAGLLTLFGFLGFQLTRVRRDRNQKAAFTEALIDAQEEERKRIARDLHDGIGQSLLVIKQQFEGNKNSSIENQRLISETLEEVRTISRDLHPILLEKFGITATMKDTVDKISTMAPNLFVSSDIADIDGLLSPKAELQIYRTVQEALSNVVKHASATAAKVTINHGASFVNVLVQDNGEGFDYELAVARSRSLGLRTMFERISSAGGRFSVKSTPGTGTEIQIKVPIAKKD